MKFLFIIVVTCFSLACISAAQECRPSAGNRDVYGENISGLLGGNKYPNLAKIVVKMDIFRHGKITVPCTGIAITTEHILTASHCIPGLTTEEFEGYSEPSASKLGDIIGVEFIFNCIREGCAESDQFIYKDFNQIDIIVNGRQGLERQDFVLLSFSGLREMIKLQLQQIGHQFSSSDNIVQLAVVESVIGYRENTPLELLHHPEGGPMQVTRTKCKSNKKTPKNILMHQCIKSRSGGSSGGPLFDEDGHLVGMHYRTCGRHGRAVPIDAVLDEMSRQTDFKIESLEQSKEIKFSDFVTCMKYAIRYFDDMRERKVFVGRNCPSNK